MTNNRCLITLIPPISGLAALWMPTPLPLGLCIPRATESLDAAGLVTVEYRLNRVTSADHLGPTGAEYSAIERVGSKHELAERKEGQ